jgi:ABC-type antimicrobial peptide transport system permease subunit
MALQEVSSTGWFGRIGGAIKGIFFGVIFFIGSMVLLVMNERNAVRDISANKEIAQNVVSIENNEVNAANEGKLVHLSGLAKTDDILRNTEFGVEQNAIRLKWNASIYQWVEKSHTKSKKKMSGSESAVTTYEYEKKWVVSPVDSSEFKEAGHDNVGQQKFKTGSVNASLVTLGAFRLPPPLIEKMDASKPLPVTKLPANLEKSGKLTNGLFHTGKDLQTPQIGDEKVEFSIVGKGDVSVMAVQSKDSFFAYKAKNGKEKFLLYDGLLSAEQVVQEEETKAKFLRWILRAGGFFLMFMGIAFVLKPLSVLADIIPIFGSFVGGVTGLIAFLAAAGISLAVIAISWVTFRPVLGITLLALGVVCFVLIVKKLKGSSARRLQGTHP